MTSEYDDGTGSPRPQPGRPGAPSTSHWVSPAGPLGAPHQVRPADDTPTVRLLAGPGSPVPLPPREGLRPTVAVLVATAVLLAGIAALGLAARARSADQVPIADVPAPAVVTPAAPTPDSDLPYRAPLDLCEAADFTGLRPTFNQIGDLSSDGDSKAGLFEAAQCDGTTGNETVQGRFTFRASVYADPGVARREFEAARAGAQSRATTASIAGAGDAGFDYIDPAAGPTVEIYDNNLRIRLSWGASDGRAAPPAGTTDALIQVCKSTMRLLRED